MTILRALLLLFPVTGFACCAWAFVDVLVRPPILFRVAGVSKAQRATWFAVMAGAIAMCATLVGLGAHGRVVGLACLFVGEPIGLVGLAVATWYLVVVRGWISAQVQFAELRSTWG